MTTYPVGRHGWLQSTFHSGSAAVRRAISGIDDRLSRMQSISSFSDDERCILRFAPAVSTRSVHLSDGVEIGPGEPIIDLHCWNERAPRMAEGGPDIAWAMHASRQLKYSLRLLAGALETIPELRSVRACRARVIFVGRGGSNESVSRIIDRLGFEDVDEGSRSLRAFIHDVLEDVLIGALVWTHNPKAMRRDKMVRERRPVWASRPTVLRLHGS